MDLHEVQAQLTGWLNEATSAFQKVQLHPDLLNNYLYPFGLTIPTTST
jgi:hypothetical protein